MREPLFNPHNEVARRHEIPGDELSYLRSIHAAALHRATTLAIESAFIHGIDLPVGAVALDGDQVVGRSFASDVRLGAPSLHAEVMTLLDTEFDTLRGKPRTVVVTAEPCVSCQDALARHEGVGHVAYGVSRTEMAEMGLVRPKDETFAERAQRIGLPYTVGQVEDGPLRVAGLTVLGHVKRDIDSGRVRVDRDGLSASLRALNKAA
jgi:tRNA(Arg) A34 adenosine deaminase TadA